MCFAMKINKSQRQTFEVIGVDLPNQMFFSRPNINGAFTDWFAKGSKYLFPMGAMKHSMLYLERLLITKPK